MPAGPLSGAGNTSPVGANEQKAEFRTLEINPICAVSYFSLLSMALVMDRTISSSSSADC